MRPLYPAMLLAGAVLASGTATAKAQMGCSGYARVWSPPTASVPTYAPTPWYADYAAPQSVKNFRHAPTPGWFAGSYGGAPSPYYMGGAVHTQHARGYDAARHR